QHMRNMMDDLLRLSRISLTELTRRRVHLDELAEEILRRWSSEEPGRRVKIVIRKGMESEADLGLLRIAMENLLSNAWKYTSKRDKARIEVGCDAQPDGSTAYFVRDNGAGFDVNGTGRLFQPFRRLHTEQEFPGSGIGLATVHRIVQRHGGRIWADAETG